MLRDVAAGMDVMVEETFGPIAPIIGVNSIEQAVELSRAARYGLWAYVLRKATPR